MGRRDIVDMSVAKLHCGSNIGQLARQRNLGLGSTTSSYGVTTLMKLEDPSTLCTSSKKVIILALRRQLTGVGYKTQLQVRSSRQLGSRQV
ncbi:hypothetical protein HPP92_016370 [Vanilla planifolia]|uniref:Uncharacterized protein n=1 Tax=Vanilla planifolia TaxID=51239 RepID=A0A835QAS7_VANPL|nr:hypothetical protein HPP92_016370 [Vanilla planifolia]